MVNGIGVEWAGGSGIVVELSERNLTPSQRNIHCNNQVRNNIGRTAFSEATRNKLSDAADSCVNRFKVES